MAKLIGAHWERSEGGREHSVENKLVISVVSDD